MARTRTGFTDARVDACIAGRASPQKAADCRTLIDLLARITGRPPRMWGPSIVGFGRYRYMYDSGHGGEAPIAGFAIRSHELVAYISADSPAQQALLARPGRHRMGKSCLYFKQLAQLDATVLEALIQGSVAEAGQRHEVVGTP